MMLRAAKRVILIRASHDAQIAGELGMSRVYLASPLPSVFRIPPRLLPVSHAYWPGVVPLAHAFRIFRITTDTGTAQGKVRQQERVDIIRINAQGLLLIENPCGSGVSYPLTERMPSSTTATVTSISCFGALRTVMVCFSLLREVAAATILTGRRVDAWLTFTGRYPCATVSGIVPSSSGRNKVALT